jgi:hypothetical protein
MFMKKKTNTSSFYKEPQHAVSVAGEGFRQDFQRHASAKARVPRAIHLTHPASTNRV